MNSDLSDIRRLVTSTEEFRWATLLEEAKVANETSSLDPREELEHLMSIPVELVINQMPSTMADSLRKQWERVPARQHSDQEPMTLGTMLISTEPEDASVRFIKQLGRDIIDKSQHCWPNDVGYALYYAGYALAIIHGLKLPGKLGSEELKKGLKRFADCIWISEPLKALFVKAELSL